MTGHCSRCWTVLCTYVAGSFTGLRRLQLDLDIDVPKDHMDSEWVHGQRMGPWPDEDQSTAQIRASSRVL